MALAEVFKVDAVVCDVFLRMFKPFGPGEELQVSGLLSSLQVALCPAIETRNKS
jgi:hypothetical protein